MLSQSYIRVASIVYQRTVFRTEHDLNAFVLIQ
jgi:hypothetical protein